VRIVVGLADKAEVAGAHEEANTKRRGIPDDALAAECMLAVVAVRQDAI
jgi:hypothetical protein